MAKEKIKKENVEAFVTKIENGEVSLSRELQMKMELQNTRIHNILKDELERASAICKLLA